MRMINPADRARVVPTGQVASPNQGSQDTTVSAVPCPLCDGSGWYKEARPAGHPNFGKLFPCDCRIAGEADRQRERQRQRLATFAQEMGGELAGCTLDNYDLCRARDAKARKSMQAALDTCRAYAHRASGWIYFYGPTGVGKSHLAAATARALAERHTITLAYASEPALMKYIRDGWGKTGDEATDARIELLQNVDLLVLDDLGTEHRGKDSTWADDQLLDILMPRYQHARWTIITSNLDIDDIDEPRIRSRIKGRTSLDFAG